MAAAAAPHVGESGFQICFSWVPAGVHPSAWPLPLSLEGVQAAEKNPVPQPVPQIVIKRAIDETGAPMVSRSMRSRVTGSCCSCRRGTLLTFEGKVEMTSSMLELLQMCLI